MMATDTPRQRRRAAGLDNPLTRPLKAFAFDPSQGRLLGNPMSMAIRYEELDRGPVVSDPMACDGIAVVDYDATNGVYYEPVDLDHPRILIRGGLDPNEADPKFHQQMVYAVATDTIQHFENALGRRIHWRRTEPDYTRPDMPNQENIYTLNIYPHAMMLANAFYSPRAHGVIFGYFKADKTNPGRNLPGQTVFTCLSHDIIVHEMTHAIIDGIRGHFMEQTNRDVLAFHEAFADIVALFRHFSYSEVLLDAIQRTGGALFEAQLAASAPLAPGATPSIGAQIAGRNPLVNLAQQFGEATGRGKGLRSALETPPNSDDIRKTIEPHPRGSILVSAIFDAFFTTYVRDTTDLFRIYRSGGGNSDTLPHALTRLLAEKASVIADVFFKVCVRALDYCPPVDITFGDFLRAVVTSDFDLHPDDSAGLRDAFMQAFRVRGIVPEGSASFSDVAIAWPSVGSDFPPVEGLVFGDPSGLTREQQDACKAALQAYVDNPAHGELLGFDPEVPVTIPSFHPVFRINQDGSLRTEMVVEALQQVQTPFDPDNPNLGTFPLRGGATMIISTPPLSDLRRRESRGEQMDYGVVRYVIGKHLHGEVGKKRADRQRAQFERLGLVAGTDPNRFQIDFALTHGGF